MLLTVFLIGLTASLVVINVGQDADDIAKLEAKRFAALVSHLQDESTITGFPMGIEIREIDNRYSFWQLEDIWVRIEKQNALRERIVPEQVALEFTLLQDDRQKSQSAENSRSEESRILLMVDPTGLARPFIMRFIGDKMIFSISLDNEFNPVLSSAQK